MYKKEKVETYIMSKYNEFVRIELPPVIKNAKLIITHPDGCIIEMGHTNP